MSLLPYPPFKRFTQVKIFMRQLKIFLKFVTQQSVLLLIPRCKVHFGRGFIRCRLNRVISGLGKGSGTAGIVLDVMYVKHQLGGFEILKELWVICIILTDTFI